MGKNINVNLQFTANTSAVKSQLQSLQQQLTQLGNTQISQLGATGLSSELTNSISKARELGVILQTSTNMETGKLNLTQFNNLLKQSGQSLSSYRTAFANLGQEGKQAFSQLTQSILNAQMPTKKLEGQLNKVMNTLANTVRWQLSSYAISGFTQFFSSGIKYAEDLNNALNQIRIVSNQTADDMDNFTKSITKASKALKVSTLDYAKASLVFYQQGLTGKEVEERTEATLKLSNVTATSASTVSEWMTAIWNNFDNGSKSLEYYADVLAKLGAATASSADEIAGGLEKFSAVADTIGLSYEYAASALATITAETRQSEDVVGTSLKTLFSRIQDLDLGKTLEDGVTLGQYSEGLNKIGVDILDATGNLKEMDTILDDLGSQWGKLTEAQKVATAQVVGGTRQYNQLIALMDNWETFQNNVYTAETSEGTLSAQQAIFEESIEASKEALATQMEDLYQDIFDEDVVKGFIDGLTEVAHGFDFLIESIGGLPGLLSLSAVLITRFAGDSIVANLRSMTGNFKELTASAQEEAMALKRAALEQNKMLLNPESESGKLQYEYESKLLKIEEEIQNIGYTLSKQDQERLKLTLDILRANQEIALAMAEQVDNTTVAASEQKKTIAQQAASLTRNAVDKDSWKSARNDFQEYAKNRARLTTAEDKDAVWGELLAEGVVGENDTIEKFIDPQERIATLQKSYTVKQSPLKKPIFSKETKNFLKQLSKAKTAEDVKALSGTVPQELRGRGFSQEELLAQSEDGSYNFLSYIDKAKNKYKEEVQAENSNIRRENKEKQRQSKVDIQEQAEGILLQAENEIKLGKAQEETGKATDGLNKKMDESLKLVQQMQKVPLGNQIMEMATGISSLSMGLSSFASGIKSLASGDLSFETILSSITGLSMGLTMIKTGFDQLTQSTLITNGIMKIFSLTEQESTIAATANAIAQSSEIAARAAKNVLLANGIKLTGEETAEQLIQMVSTNGLTAALQQQTAAEIAKQTAQKMGNPILFAALAAVAALVIGIKSLVSWYNKDANAATEAAKQAENLANTYNEVKQAAENAQSAFENYTDTQKALEALTEGTQEWKEALIEANQEVLELLNTYPKLAQFVENSNGRLTISDEGWSYLTETLSQQVAYAQNIQSAGNLEASRTALQSAYTDFIRDFASGSNGLQKYLALEDVQNAIFGNIDRATDLEEKLSFLGTEAESTAEQIRDLRNQYETYKLQREQYISNTTLNTLQADSRYSATAYTEAAQKYVEEYSKGILETKRDTKDLHWYSGLTADLTKRGKDGRLEDTYNDYAWSHGFGVARTEHGDEILKEYLEKVYGVTSNIDNIAKDFNFSSTGLIYKGDDGYNNITYEDLANFENQLELASVNSMSKMFEVISATNNLAWERTNDTEKVLSSYFTYGNLDLLDPELLQTASNLNTDDLNVWVKKNEEYLETLGKNIDEVKEEIQKQADNLTSEELTSNRIVRAKKEYTEDIKTGAESLEVDEEALEAYAEKLQKENGILEENKTIASESAVAHFTIALAIKELRDTLDDNLDTLQNTNSNTIEYAQSLGEVKKALDEVLGSDVSSDFIKENLSLIQEMLAGSVEAYETLKELTTNDWVTHLDISEDEQQSILAFFDEVAEKTKDWENGFSSTFDISTTNGVNKLNELLRTGQITAEQVQAAFNNMDLQWDGNFKTYSLPTTTTSTSTMTVGDQVYTIKTVSTTDTTLPWLGENPPQFQAITDADTLASVKNEQTLYNTSGKKLTEEEKNNLQIGDVVQTSLGDATGVSLEKSTNLGITSDVLLYDDEDDSKRKKELDDELTRYHEIKEILEDIERELDEISKAKERAFGKAKLGYIDQEIQKQKELLAAEKRYQQEAEKYYKSDRQELLSNFAVKLDADGRISNYTALEKQLVEAAKSGGETAEDRLDYFKELVENYEDSLNTIEEQQQAVIEAQYELQDLALEKIQYTVEFKIEGLEDTLKEIEFLMQEVENDAFAAATSIALAGQQANNTLQQINVNSQGIKDVEAALEAGTIATEDGIEQLREYRDELIDLNSELLELRETVKEELTEAFEAWNEKLEDNVSILEHCTALLDGYKSIIDLIGKDMLGISDEVISALNQAKLSNANDIITSTRAQLEANNAVLADYRAKRASARTDEERADWDEQIKLAEEKSRELEETLQESLEAGLEAAIGVFEGTVDQIADNFSKAVSGIADSLSELQEMFERQEEVAERYLENYERTYELNKLNRQINQQLSNTKYTKELLELQEELSEYAESDEKMSKNQLTQKQKYYDLLVAEIALREAENNKSVVRLRRDSEGNYGYVYTADQDAIADAQQKYEDALYAYQDFIHNFETEMSQMWIELDTQREEQIRAAAEQYGEGTEEFIEAQKRINEQFEEDTRYITTQYSWMCDQNKKVNAEFQAGVAQTYNETMLGQIYPDYAEFADLYNETLEANKTASEELEAAMVALGTTISDEFELAGIDTDDFSSEFIAKFQAIVKQSNTTASAIEDFADDMATAMEEAANSAKSFYKTYNTQMEAVRKATSSTITSVNSLISKYAELAAAESNSSNKSDQGTSSGGTGGKTVDTVSADDDVKTAAVGNQLKVINTAWSTSGTRYQLSDNKWYSLSQLNASKQGHTTKGDLVTVKTGNKGSSSEYETYSLKDVSLTAKNAAEVRQYGENGEKGSMLHLDTETRLTPLKELSIVGYKYDEKQATNLYKLSKPWQPGAGGSFGGLTYWLNQTDLHQLLNKVGQPALYKSVALQKYDTGGYTGDWNTTDGKLALLHEKELVLNKNETADFLRMTEQFRNIIANYDYQAAMKQIEFSLSAGLAPNGTPQAIVQDVNISASFPNATNHSEIEQAFKNLINLSSQYVNRKS